MSRSAMSVLLVLFVGFMLLLPTGAVAVSAALRGDDPGPRLQYGGTPIELHFDAPGANVTKVYVDGTPCIVVSFAPGEVRDSKKYGIDNPTLALSCDWTRR